MSLPDFNEHGDLPVDVHVCSLEKALARFARANPKRIVLGERLKRICNLATSTEHVARFIVFGSFITSKPEPNDVDVFLLMDDDFDLSQTEGEARILFDHGSAQPHFGASVFWVRRLAALGGDEKMVEDWQIKRDGNRRGILEIEISS
ncbi:MAG: hypothetical protein ACI8UO_003405 [Verrucomicrobiales bacterium]|jgi:hypothetical protein